MRITCIVGTLKGAFLLHTDESRRDWSIEGPSFKGWKVTASSRDLDGGFLLATASDVYGAAVHRSGDLREWRQVEKGPAYDEDSGTKLNQIWFLAGAGERLYAGVDEAGLFSSADRGESWELVRGLTDHPSRDNWFPGFGGLCAHCMLFDPRDPDRMWVGISAVGVFRTEDGGRSWESKNEGVPCIIEDEEHEDIGYCVHALVQDPDDPDTIWRQDHRGMFRTRDGGDRWEEIQEGLPSTFGFPLVLDRRTRTLFAVPLESDEFRIPSGGALRVYRSRDGGDSWHALTGGLPQEHAYMGVLRSAVAADSLDPCGVVVGTTAGSLHVTRDGGDGWRTLPWTLPRILSVETYVGG